MNLNARNRENFFLRQNSMLTTSDLDIVYLWLLPSMSANFPLLMVICDTFI